MDNFVIDVKLIEDIRDYIHLKTGMWYFKYIRQLPDNISVTCPFHKGGQENKASASIRTTEGDRSYIGLFSCFTCHETMSLAKVVELLLGPLYDEEEVESLFGLKTIQARAVLIEKPKRIMFDLKKKSYVPKEDITKLKYYHPYLENRRIDKQTAEKYDLGFDPYNKHIVFPIYDKGHNCIGLGRRSIEQKVYRYPQDMIKPLYGLYELDRFLRYIWIVEGPFNVWSLSGWGKQSVGLLGTGTELQYKQLLEIECKGYVLALDPDEAGRKGIYKLGNFLHEHRKQNINVALIPEGKDVNDLTYDEFRQVKVISYSEWKRWYESKILSSE